MATSLTGDATRQQIIDYFNEFFVSYVNSGIVWTKNTPPISVVQGYTEYPKGGYQINVAAQFTSRMADGTTVPPTLNTNKLGSGEFSLSTITSALIAEANRFSAVRRMRYTVTVTGNRGGLAFDQTQIANMLASFGAPINATLPPTGDLSASAFQAFLTRLRNAYINIRDSVVDVNISVCHASCHSNCHGSRNRR